MNRVLLLALALAGCDGGSEPSQTATQGWTAGPIIAGVNYSPGATIAGNVITIPATPGHANYITQPCSLVGKQHIALTYRFEGQATPTSDPAAPTMISLYFQAKGDDWQTDGKRWYGGTVSPIGNGGTIDLSLTGRWTSVMKMTSDANPVEFADAKASADTCGFVLGGGTGLGHGINGPATLTVDSFLVG